MNETAVGGEVKAFWRLILMVLHVRLALRPIHVAAALSSLHVSDVLRPISDFLKTILIIIINGQIKCNVCSVNKPVKVSSSNGSNSPSAQLSLFQFEFTVFVVSGLVGLLVVAIISGLLFCCSCFCCVTFSCGFIDGCGSFSSVFSSDSSFCA